MGAHGRVVGNLIRAGTCRLCGAARDNAPVCSVATGKPASVSEIHGRYTAESRVHSNAIAGTNNGLRHLT